MIQPWKYDRKVRLGRSNLNVATGHALEGEHSLCPSSKISVSWASHVLCCSNE